MNLETEMHGAEGRKADASSPTSDLLPSVPARWSALTLVPLVLVLAAGSGLAATATNAAAKKAGSHAGKSAVGGATNTSTASPVAETPLPKSSFIVAMNGSGRDPFFPNTTRFTPQITTAANTNKTAVAVEPEIKLNGFSGSAEQPLVIVNNMTFGVGDEQQVPTGNTRSRVRCVEIRPADQVAVLEVNGTRREIRFLKKN